jgi:hypothetical protein
MSTYIINVIEVSKYRISLMLSMLCCSTAISALLIIINAGAISASEGGAVKCVAGGSSGPGAADGYVAQSAVWCEIGVFWSADGIWLSFGEQWYAVI